MMKLTTAKIIYFAAVGLSILLLLSMATTILIAIAPMVWSLFAMGVCLVGTGMILGWAEKKVEKESTYKKAK